MKKIILLSIILCGLQTTSQEKLGEPFFTSSVNFTLGRNEYDEGFGDEEPFFVPAAVFIRAGFGYEFRKRAAISFNAGFDYHWHFTSISAFPTYVTFKLNISENQKDTFFVEASCGKMWRISSKYPDGNYYGFGIGTQIAGSSRWNTIIKLDFHRKGILGFENDRLDSVSIGVGFTFF